jgi:hypothetical protein
MTAICTPVLLIGRERVVRICGDASMCAIYRAQGRVERIVEVAGERDHQKSED